MQSTAQLQQLRNAMKKDPNAYTDELALQVRELDSHHTSPAAPIHPRNGGGHAVCGCARIMRAKGPN